MILTVALNPVVEKTAVIDGLEIDGVNHIQDYRLVLGPSAIYSAYIIKLLQGEPYVIGFAGGIGGRYIKNFMEKNRIKSDLLWKDRESRSVFRIIDSVYNTKTVLMDNTFSYDEKDKKNIKHKLQILLKDTEVVIVNDAYHEDEAECSAVSEIIGMCKETGKKLIISLSDHKLRKAIEESPYAIVITKKDIKDLKLEPFLTREELLELLRNLTITAKIRYIVYDDAESIYVVSRNKICRTEYLKAEEGLELMEDKDILTGVTAIAIARKYEIEKMVKLLYAAKLSVKLQNFPQIVTRKEMDQYYKKAKVQEVYSGRNGYSRLVTHG